MVCPPAACLSRDLFFLVSLGSGWCAPILAACLRLFLLVSVLASLGKGSPIHFLATLPHFLPHLSPFLSFLVFPVALDGILGCQPCRSLWIFPGCQLLSRLCSNCVDGVVSLTLPKAPFGDQSSFKPSSGRILLSHWKILSSALVVPFLSSPFSSSSPFLSPLLFFFPWWWVLCPPCRCSLVVSLLFSLLSSDFDVVRGCLCFSFFLLESCLQDANHFMSELEST